MSWVEVFVRQEVPARIDVVRSFLLELSLSPVLQDLARRAIAALDAEREAHETLKMKYAMMEKFADDSVKRRAAETEEHAKDVADLKQRISELELAFLRQVLAGIVGPLAEKEGDMTGDRAKEIIYQSYVRGPINNEQLLKAKADLEALQQENANLKQRIAELEAKAYMLELTLLRQHAKEVVYLKQRIAELEVVSSSESIRPEGA